ncbi:hypothetical protein H4R33_002977 [Dimargaris cristalligena]|uniref:4-coumarate-CoA ligase n=1 Tax=Dimargaris cristalligena TaxID=215637 RepID=A0A4P9ZZW4_9FUNG|nr:hypothetical protein H4R33_002977 [Dimargaris cristalligena]RKP39346.1 hypothetical protein BJ085DRAFT_22146 [Dimargaris cristalligena]|eukprot:RKP39346.1 hypothetical protein BJ085DRAFT_22146 [Dimargaris cristalligena]
MIFKSIYPSIDIPALDIGQFILQHIDTHEFWQDRTRPVYIDAATAEVLTVGQFRTQVTELASGWRHRVNLKPGTVVAMVSPNTIFFGVLTLSVILAGGVVAFVNPTYTAGEMAYQLQDSGAHYMVVDNEIATKTLEAATMAELPHSRIYQTGPSPSDPKERGGRGGMTGSSLPSIMEQRDTRPWQQPPTIPPNTPAYICYSSGTTGLSKGVVLTHRNMVANVSQVNAFTTHNQNTHNGQTLAGVLPLFHTYALHLLLHLNFIQGFTTIIFRKFRFEPFLQAVERFRIHCAYLVPPVIVALFKNPLTKLYDLSSLNRVVSGAAPFSAELVKEILDCYHTRVHQGYGLSEASPVVLFTAPQTQDLGSVGILIPNMEAKFVDGKGKELGYGEQGELCIRGPNVMLGYLNNPEATAQTIDADGFLHTGDLGYVDENGEFYITDRFKELIKYKGFQVPPAELEAILVAHPKVRDVVVIGVNDVQQITEVPRALVVLQPKYQRDDSQLSRAAVAQELIAYVNSQVAHHKHLRGGVYFIDAIVKSAAGKILRREMREMHLKSIQAREDEGLGMA